MKLPLKPSQIKEMRSKWGNEWVEAESFMLKLVSGGHAPRTYTELSQHIFSKNYIARSPAMAQLITDISFAKNVTKGVLSSVIVTKATQLPGEGFRKVQFLEEAWRNRQCLSSTSTQFDIRDLVKG